MHRRLKVFVTLAALFPLASLAEAERVTVLDAGETAPQPLVLQVPDPGPLCDETRVETIDANGCAFRVERHGQEDAPVLVLLHGGPGATHHVFHPHFTRAESFSRVVYYDQRGCGSSRCGSPDPYTIQQAVDDLEALRQSLGVSRWIVLGHSYGGTLAQMYARAHPERLRGLVLVGSALYGHGLHDLGSREQDYISRDEAARIQAVYGNPDLDTAQLLYNAHRNGDWKRQTFFQPDDTELARKAHYAWAHDPRLRSQISSSLAKLDIAGDFEHCPIPMLVVEGKWDLTWSAAKPEHMREVFPNATVEVVDHAGHSPFADQPDDFFGLLQHFVESAEATSSERVTAWKEEIDRRTRSRAESPAGLIDRFGYNYAGSRAIARRYEPDWLDTLSSTRHLFRLAFALYDVKRYEEAIDVLDAIENASDAERKHKARALLWRGHLLDLLDRRDAAVQTYERVIAMGERTPVTYSPYDYSCEPVSRAQELLRHPFERLENQYR